MQRKWTARDRFVETGMDAIDVLCDLNSRAEHGQLDQPTLETLLGCLLDCAAAMETLATQNTTQTTAAA